MKKLFLLICLFVFAGASLLAQNKVITGTVTSAVAGEGSLPGVTVQVKGTTVGAITDLNGNYSISAPTTATTIVFSYVGMKAQEVQIAGRSVVNCVMESETLGLNEVVVTAFGIKREAKSLGVATATVSDQQLTQAGASNAVNGLTGKVSGLQISTVNNGVNPDTRITLRGNRHLLATNQALVVLDGVPVSADYLNSLNPNDIGSVNILKGASASALYGNDASNGVLVVTTKRGGGNVPTIKISNITTFETVSYMPKLQEQFGSGSGEDTANSLSQYTFWIGPGRNTDPYTSYENQQYGPEYNGAEVILGGVLADGSYQMVKYSAVKDQKKKFFQTGISMQNDVSYSVGDDKNSFYLSLQDVKTTGIIKDDKNRRTGIRVAGSRTSGIFHADYSLGFTQSNTNVSGDDYFQQRPVYWMLLNTPGEVDVTAYQDVDNNKFANHNGYFNAYYSNPYWQIKYSRYKTTVNNLLGSVLLDLKPVEWLDISYRGGITYRTNNRTYFRDPVVFNSYMKGDPWLASHTAAGSPFAGVASDYIYDNMILTGDFLIQANNKFGDFTSKLVLGNSVYSYHYRYLYLGNNSIVIPYLYNIANRLGEPGVTETERNRNSVGVFADYTLGFRDFAFLHGSIRNDWDSRLVAANRSFYYPAVDVSIVLTDAIQSLKNNPVLSFLKVRGGWSETGQISLTDYYATLPQFNSAAGFPFNVGGYTLNTTLSNPTLVPEKTRELEGGFEASFMKNRFHVTFNAYKSNTFKQTIPATIPYSTGFGSAYINAGELQTKGIEVDLNITPIVSAGDFDWNLTLSYSYNTSKVLSIIAGLNEISIGDISYAIVGEQFPALKVTDVLRDTLGRIIVDPITGYPKKDPALRLVGHANPNHILGITSTMHFKNFTLNAVADYRSGNLTEFNMGSDLDFTGTSWHSAQNNRQNFVIPNSVYQSGVDSKGKPVYTENTNIITRNASRLFWVNSDYAGPAGTLRPFVASAAFWKLREVSLTYNVPVERILGGKIKDAQIGILGRNLLMFVPATNTYTDPEFNNNAGASNSLGYTTVYQTPPTRVYGFTVKLTF
jgi:TonB-linked SusC/RagA family outer membrane protein